MLNQSLSLRLPCSWLLTAAVAVTLCLTGQFACAQALVPEKAPGVLRVATFNVSLNRNAPGKLTADLEDGNAQISTVAAVIRAIQPDILLLNEVDYSTQTDNAAIFSSKYLGADDKDLLGGSAWPMPHHYTASVNTGLPSGLDLDQDGHTDRPNDAWGYGRFPGQYGMAILSRFPIDTGRVRTFQQFRWAELPNALRPDSNGAPYYADDIWQQLRLSSKSFWDAPIETPMGQLHVLASHPTPPAFDGPEDRNGCRNHDEIMLLVHYIRNAARLRDDQGRTGGLDPSKAFVILGDLNSDPQDGGSRPAAIEQLLHDSRIAKHQAPRSAGAALSSQTQAGANTKQQGNASEDTADFNDRSVGNLRVDYVLPSVEFQVVNAGVFWPDLSDVPEAQRAPLQECLTASDHHLVWVDIRRE